MSIVGIAHYAQPMPGQEYWFFPGFFRKNTQIPVPGKTSRRGDFAQSRRNPPGRELAGLRAQASAIPPHPAFGHPLPKGARGDGSLPRAPAATSPDSSPSPPGERSPAGRVRGREPGQFPLTRPSATLSPKGRGGRVSSAAPAATSPDSSPSPPGERSPAGRVRGARAWAISPHPAFGHPLPKGARGTGLFRGRRPRPAPIPPPLPPGRGRPQGG